MRAGLHAPTRLTGGAAALAGIVLTLLALGDLAEAWTFGIVAPSFAAWHLELAWGLKIAASGVGFAVLALAIVWKVGERGEALIAALFLGSYALWSGLAVVLEGPWRRPGLVLIDGLVHAVGIRFTQRFPRRLSRDDVAEFGSAWFRKTGGRVLAALVDARVFWPVALLIEVAGRTLPFGAGAYYGHLVTWLALGVAYLYIGYRRGSAEDRRRLFWILEGVLVFLVVELGWTVAWVVDSAGIAELHPASWGPWVGTVEAWAALACFSLAVFYSGALHPGLVLRRTAVLSAAGSAAVLIFVTIESVFAHTLANVLGADSPAGAIVAGVVAGLALRPLADRLDRLAGRLGKEGGATAEPAPSTSDGPGG